MKRAWDFLKTTFLGGALVVLPAWVAVLLVAKVLVKLEVIVKPVSATLPEGVGHPRILAALALAGLCFVVGAAVRTAIGRQAQRAIERSLLDRVPGYRTLRGLAQQVADTEGDHGFKPAFVETGDGLAPCFLVERHADGRCTVFVPSSPTPAAGSILVVEGARVHPVDVPVATMFKCVSKWGAGAEALVGTIAPRPSGGGPSS
jgi:uncharacterized membrane protein